MREIDGMAKIIDGHFHWYPGAVFEKLCEETVIREPSE
jgi:hypothetical protein